MTGNFPFWTVLIFSQPSFRSDRYGAVAFLGDNPLKVQLRSVLEHFLAVPDQVLGINDRKLDAVFAKQFGQRLLSFDLREFSEITITPQKIEGVINQPVLMARGELSLKFRKICATFVDNDHFAIDDRLAGKIEGAGDQGKPFRPVQPVSGEDLPLPFVQVDLDPVAVEFDLVKPLRPDWHLGFQGRKLGLNESRHNRLLGHRPALTHTLYGLSPPPAGAVSLTAGGSGMRGHVLVSKSI
jgi:hypothetical protein